MRIHLTVAILVAAAVSSLGSSIEASPRRATIEKVTNSRFTGDVVLPSSFRNTMHKNPGLLDSLVNNDNRYSEEDPSPLTLVHTFSADVLGPVALLSRNLRSKHHRDLQETVNCFQEGFDIVCFVDDAPGPGFVVFWRGCTAVDRVVDILECETCTISATDDPQDYSPSDPHCSSCEVCPSGSSSAISFDCSNLVADRCAVLNCAGQCSPGDSGPDQSTLEPAFCEPSTDSCPRILQANGMCDQETYSICANGDCLDCDPCFVQYSYDCSACVANGCFWCPGDAVCSSYDITIDHNIRISSCSEGEWLETCPEADPDNVFEDPLYESMQWAYDLIDVEAVWRQGVTGAGIHIRINDGGVDPDHAEFSGKFDVSNSCPLYTPGRADDGGPETHGTATASIAAGNANDECAVGIAPGASISSCRIISDDGVEENNADGFLLGLEVVDVSSNSWGVPSCVATDTNLGRRLQQCPFNPEDDFSPCSSCDFSGDVLSEACEDAIIIYCLNIRFTGRNDRVACNEFLDLFVRCGFNALPDDYQEALDHAIVEGRGGKGTVLVFSSGNEFGSGSDINFGPLSNSRLTISVGSVGKNGLHASYSTPGAALFVSAPGGDFEFRSNNIVAKTGGGCHEAGVGTSISCPVVSGVVALMLQVNPDLGWRDVQGIIATTSQNTDPSDESWSTNAAGLAHSYKYGFGVISASAAVDAARSWENFGPELFSQDSSGPLNIPISDDPTAVVASTLTITDDLVVESVVVYLDVLHSSRGHLKVVLTSPSGTESILSPGSRPENHQMGDNERWKLMTVRAWGESSAGDWTLSVVDEEPGDVSECVDIAGWLAVTEDRNGETFEVTCNIIEINELCIDGEPQTERLGFRSDEDGVSALDACCACGGGSSTPASFIDDALESWRLVVYGHESSAAASLLKGFAGVLFSLTVTLSVWL